MNEIVLVTCVVIFARGRCGRQPPRPVQRLGSSADCGVVCLVLLGAVLERPHAGGVVLVEDEDDDGDEEEDDGHEDTDGHAHVLALPPVVVALVENVHLSLCGAVLAGDVGICGWKVMIEFRLSAFIWLGEMLLQCCLLFRTQICCPALTVNQFGCMIQRQLRVVLKKNPTVFAFLMFCSIIELTSQGFTTPATNGFNSQMDFLCAH